MDKDPRGGTHHPLDSLTPKIPPTFPVADLSTTETSPNAAWFRAYKSDLDRLSCGKPIAPLPPELTSGLQHQKTPVFCQSLSSSGSPASNQELGNSTLLFDSPRYAHANFTFASPAGSPSVTWKETTSSPIQEEGLTNFGYSVPQNTNFSFQAPNGMVIEREPPSKAPGSPQKDNQRLHQPAFGSPSPLRSTLTKVFNIPPGNKPRPEHHRPVNSGISAIGELRYPSDRAGSSSSDQRYNISRDSDVQEIPKPTNQVFPAIRPSERLAFSSLGGTDRGFVSVNQGMDKKAPIDLTGGSKDFYGMSSVVPDRFGAADTYAYIDPAKTAETIKALLEGAFDDDDDKPKTRSRKKKQEAEATGLVGKMESLGVGTNDESGVSKDESDEEEEVEDDGTVEGLNVKLLPHQVHGVKWMKEKEKGKPKGGILADDMGLGKTIQSIALILMNTLESNPSTDKKTARSTLVVAPLALIKQWEKEIKDRVSGSHKLSVCVHHGPNRTKRYQDLQRYDVVITTYQILASEHANSSDKEGGLQVGCFGVYWYRVILDEAHSIKNHLAKSSKACYALRAKYRWCLTGTPMQNNLDELQSLIRFLAIKPYDNPKVWKEQITLPMKNGQGRTAITRLQYFLKAVMKRRTKDVLKKDGALNPGGKAPKEGEQGGFQITERKIEEIKATFSEKEREFYGRLEKRTDRSLQQMEGGGKLNYANALVLLLRLRQACNHPELVAGKLAEDKDALAVSNGTGQVPRKSKASATEVDDITNLLGGLAVVTTNCEVCMLELSHKEVANGAIRCSGCQSDIVEMKSRKGTHGSKGKSKTKTTNPRNRVLKHRPRVVDSDDEDDDQGEWIVPEKQRNRKNPGKAGGSDDENAEGGGEWVGDEDTSVVDESDSEIARLKRERVFPPYTSDEGSLPEEDLEGDNSSDEEDISSLAASTKTECLLEILHREAAKHKFIVFSQFTSMLDLIEPFLEHDGFNYARYDGSMRNDQREASLDRLRNSQNCRILLCSLKCGSLGLNLTAASRVVILEPFWNPFVEEQAIDRVHRLNQTVDVVVYKITIKNTVEERILELQKKKRELANAAIEGKAVAKLSMKDIMSLFQHNHQAPPDPKDVSLGAKMRVLTANPGSWVESSGLGKGGIEQQGVRKISQPIHKQVASAGDPAWGRRWW
ncbi:hypothetical protein FGG08_005371 [Glutinoglossum americanum]|uniref:Uncharacterized protein n=1 Tax=Glutinoglossum americanum TaxID=1670608 RepID=A0A9P8I3Q7_9PEZI|nr:hypothetical protein FGG08_005371 [Glutinoglossum americanum]